VYVGTGVAAIVAGNITDVRPAMIAAAAEPATASVGTLARPDTAGEIWVAKAGVNGGAWRKARDVLAAHWSRNAAFAVGATAAIVYDTNQRDPYGLYSSAVGFTAPIAGWYDLFIAVGAASTAAGQLLTGRVNINGTLTLAGQAQSGAANTMHCVAGGAYYLNAGDVVQPAASSPTAGLVGATGAFTYGSFAYRGNG
jgi:hypothetical protein